MIKIKHLMDAVEADDGRRLWVEPIGLTKDLREWCKADMLLCHVAPPRDLWQWFQEHPEGYEYFRGRYHAWLSNGTYRAALRQLACAAVRENITLLHQGDDPEQNSAVAFYEYLVDLEAFCPPEEEAP